MLLQICFRVGELPYFKFCAVLKLKENNFHTFHKGTDSLNGPRIVSIGSLCSGASLAFQAFHFLILVYFSAHVYMIVNIMRQHWYGAGGFSYKSTWTLQELCPLSILVVNFC